MKLQDLYSKDISRAVNPAVSVSDLDEKTVHTEIEEYVFTDEIINGLYTILSAIKNKKVHHTGIWLNGYYGSGKSHFLKYLHYCISSKYQEKALKRLVEAVGQRDPMQCQDSTSEVMPSDMRELAQWLHQATVDIVLFNIGTVHNIRGNDKQVFTEVFWGEFNAFRGFNHFNIALAQLFEKLLQSKGVFEAFKLRLEEEGFDWEKQADDLATQELDFILDIGKELVPTMSIDAIRPKIVNDDYNVSVEKFMNELQLYLADKNDNYRLLFLVDEVSQFINNRRGVLLQLQELITSLHEKCEDKIWVACTAQQDLSELVDACNIVKGSEDYGKIMGRFEVRASLKSTQPEYITQKRILDKKGTAMGELGKLYQEKKDAISSQFQLPTSYRSYITEQDFIDYYPFVPYQFKLIAKVFSSFENLGYVVTEVKDNERSILKITHSTAKLTKDEEVGKFISFDQFFREMFDQNLTALGQKAMKNAKDIISTYPEPVFGERVVKIIFMICNLSDTEKLLFPASLENIVCLLMQDVDANKLRLRSEVEKVLQFLIEKSVLRSERGKDGAPDTYCLYSEDEMQVAQLIKNQQPDVNSIAEQLKNIFFGYLSNPSNKVIYYDNTFTVGVSIMGRNYLTNNPDVAVEFVMDCDTQNPDQYSLTNEKNRLAVFLFPLYDANKELKRDFFWYCQVQKYRTDVPPANDSRAQTNKEFAKRALEVYTNKIKPAFHKMFDTCYFITGNGVIRPDELGVLKGADRYKEGLSRHLSKLYPNALLCSSSVFPRTTDELKKRILKSVEAGDYSEFSEMTKPEQLVETFLNRQVRDVMLPEILRHFKASPYGWSDFSTIYVVNELVRRGTRAFTYNNEPNCTRELIADKIVRSSEQSKFAVTVAEQIPQDLINEAIEAWKYIFNTVQVFNTIDGNELFRQMKDPEGSALGKIRKEYKVLYDDCRHYPFSSVLSDLLDMLDEWSLERDPEKFFKRVIAYREQGHICMDRCKQVAVFMHDQANNYKRILKFLDGNTENFDYLPDSCWDSLKELKKLKMDEWPIQNFRIYLKLQKEIEGEIKKVKDNIRQEIEKNYNEVFDHLDQLATEKNVDRFVYADREAIILRKKASEQSISTLKLNLDTSEFFTDQAKKILEEANRKVKRPVSGGGDSMTPDLPDADGSSSKVAESTSIKPVALNTRTVKVMKTERDVDEYLSTLKEQLMSYIQKKEQIIIK